MLRGPPRLARLLLGLLPDPAKEFVRGDLEEEFSERVLPGEGWMRASLWFWAQTIRSLLSFIGFRPSERSIRASAPTGGPRLDGVAHDLRLALRNLWRRPGFTSVAVLTLGLGIGTCTAMFAAFDTAFFRPLPVDEPDHLLRVWIGNRETGFTTNPMTVRDYLDLRESTRLVELAVYAGTGMNVSLGEDTEWRIGIRGSVNLSRVLGIHPQLGRGFLPEDERAGAPRTVILGHSFWTRELGADGRVLGRTLILDGEPYTVVGVLPPNVRLPQFQADYWIPLQIRGDEPRSNHSYWGLGRFPQGVTLEQAREDLQAAARAVAERDPGQRFPDAAVAPFVEAILGPDVVKIGWAFGSAVLFVLLIACANIANLLLARGMDRGHEIAVRNALGGGRRRVLRHLLTEALLLAVLGGAVGVGLAEVGIRMLRAYVISPSELQIGLDHRVLLACLLLTLASALLFGLLPALISSKVDLRSRLQAGTRGVLGGRRRRLGQALVVAQVAMVLALLVSAGLITKSLVVLDRVPLGFRTDDLLTFRISPPPSRYPEGEELQRFHREFRERVAAIPGVMGVGMDDNRPIGYGSSTGFTVPGRGEGEAEIHRSTQTRVVDGSFQRVMGLRLLAGRWLDEGQETPDGPPVAVVSRTLAEALWGTPGAAPGETLDAYGFSAQVVGVVEAGRMLGPQEGPPFVLYLSMEQDSRRSYSYVVESPLDPAALLPLIWRELREMDPAVAIQGAQTVRDQVDDILDDQHISLRLFFVFGGLAMVLTLVGVFGVVSHEVSRQGREMGLRIALGAHRLDLIRHVLFRSGRVSALGMVLGVGLSLAFGKVLGALFVGIRPAEPDILAAVLVLTGLAVAGASYLPARRAARVDPVRTLNAE